MSLLTGSTLPVYNVDGWRRAARRRLPKMAFDFIDGGADDEVTLGRNRAAFDDLVLVPRVLRGVSDISTGVELFGRSLTMPVLLGPTGGSSIAGPNGEVDQARGAVAGGTVSILSGFSSVDPATVARSVPEPQWFQLYQYQDRRLAADVVASVRDLGYQALVVTVDTPVAGNRERDLRNGLKIPMKVRPRMAVEALRKPRWTLGYLRQGPMKPNADQGSLTGPSGASRDLKTLAEYVQSTMNMHQTWDDIEWLRGIWAGPMLIKGILCGEDARIAMEVGCEGVIVSNHGGRQLDSAPATIEVLEEVASAVDGAGVVLLDGGVRRGTDVIKAVSLGANACLVGRPWLFALAVGGDKGVATMLGQLQAEIARAMRLLGVGDIASLGPTVVRRRSGSSALHPVLPRTATALSNPTRLEEALHG